MDRDAAPPAKVAVISSLADQRATRGKSIVLSPELAVPRDSGSPAPVSPAAARTVIVRKAIQATRSNVQNHSWARLGSSKRRRCRRHGGSELNVAWHDPHRPAHPALDGAYGVDRIGPNAGPDRSM